MKITNLKLTLLGPIIKTTFSDWFCFLLFSFGLQEIDKVCVLDEMVTKLSFDLLSHGGGHNGYSGVRDLVTQIVFELGDYFHIGEDCHIQGGKCHTWGIIWNV